MSATNSSSTVQIPGYVAGSWTIDPVHTDVSFTVRHMMVSKVRGKFHGVTGSITLADNPLESSVTADVDLSTIDTGNEQRDGHIKSADFFEVETYKTMSYRSTKVVPDGDDYRVEGELTLHGVTKPVTLELELNGFQKDPYGGLRAGFSAKGQINRKDFGITIDMPMDGGGAVIGDKVQLVLEIEAILDQDQPQA